MVATLERPRPARTAGDVARAVLRGVGQTLVTLGVVLLLFVVYELWVTDRLSDRAQAQVADRLRDEWTADGDLAPSVLAPSVPAPSVLAPSVLGPPTVGQPFAFLHVPRLGEDWSRAVVEGTAQEELAQGPGHYPGTALPGGQGNFAVAGHRVGRGSPFLDLDTMRPGDPVVVETADAWFTYRVLGAEPGGIPGSQVVLPTDLRVISPTPDAPADAPASGAYLTITTCHPKFSARQRLVLHAVLDGAPVSKAEAPAGPSALSGR